MEIRGQIHASTALFEVKQLSTSTGKETVSNQRPSCTLWKGKTPLYLAGIPPKFLRCRKKIFMDRDCRFCGIFGCYETAMSLTLRQQCHSLWDSNVTRYETAMSLALRQQCHSLWDSNATRYETAMSLALRQHCHSLCNKPSCDKRTCLFPICPIENSVIERLTLLESIFCLNSVTWIQIHKDVLPFAHAHNTHK
jgi:hypothetical protein